MCAREMPHAQPAPQLQAKTFTFPWMIFLSTKIRDRESDVEVHACNPSIQKAEPCGSQIQGSCELHSDTLSPKMEEKPGKRRGDKGRQGNGGRREKEEAAATRLGSCTRETEVGVLAICGYPWLHF